MAQNSDPADPIALKVAAFVAQALSLEDDPASLAPHVVALKRDANAGISSLELDSSVGPAAFLVYHYHLSVADAEGRTGRELFEADLATLEQAAKQDLPGPRILAHALTDDEAYILATTPATYRALTGQEEPESLAATAADLLPGAETLRIRRESATELLRLLREADLHAGAWLKAIHAEGRLAPAEESSGILPFVEEERALALFLLDERSIANLLRAIQLMLHSAHAQARQATSAEGEEPEAAS